MPDYRWLWEPPDPLPGRLPLGWLAAIAAEFAIAVALLADFVP